MDPSSLDTLSSATPLFSGLIDSADMTVVLVQTLGRNIDGRMCCTGVTLSAPSAPSVSVTVDEAKALVEDKFEDQPTTLLALRDELSNVPILSSGCFGSLQSALTPPSCKVLAECLLPKMLDLLEEETLEEETPIDEADLSRQLSPLYDVSEIYMAAVDRIMKAAQPSPRATSPLFGHPDLIGVYGSAINRGAFKQPLADSQTPRAQSPYMDHPALSGVYTSAIDRGAFKQSAAEARLKGEAATPRSPRATSPLRHHPALNGAYDSAIAHGAFKSEADAQSPRATSPLLGHSGLTGVYDSAMQRGAFKERKPEAPQILRIKYESEEEAQPSPRSMSPLRNHPALDGVYAAALNRGAFKGIKPHLSPRTTSPLIDHPALAGVYDSAIDRGAFRNVTPEKAAEAFDNDNTTKSTEDKADFGNLLHHAADSAAAVLIVQRMLRGYASRRKVHAKRAREWAVYVGLADSAQSRRHFRWVGRNGTFMALSRYKSDGTYDLCTIDMATGQLSVASDPENNDLNVPRQVIVGDVVDQSGGGLVGAPSTAPDEILVTASGHHTERAVLDDGSILRDFADGWQEQRCSDGTLTIQGAAGVMQVTDDRTLILHPSGSATDSYPETIQVDNDDTILISFEDGTNRQFMPDGSRTTQLPDGTVEQVNVSGVKITQYPDGQQMQTELDGTTLVRGTDGSITQTSQDGTITRKMLNGTRHKVLPDKSEIWYYTDGTRMEVSAPPEKTIRRFAVTGEEVLEE